MPLIAREVLERASTLLQDAGNTRWTLPQLLRALNDGVREITVMKPNAVSRPVVIDMARGTLQTLPVSHTSLIRVVRNVVADPDPGADWMGGNSITPIERQILDSQTPGWQDPGVMPYSPYVAHVIQDQADLRTFYVVPGNDGTGKIEVIAAVMPDDIPLPASPLDISFYTASVLVPEYLRSALVDYVCYRSFQVDAGIGDAGNRAADHYQRFQSALSNRFGMEAMASLRTTDGGATAGER